jgi:hypothetical protein
MTGQKYGKSIGRGEDEFLEEGRWRRENKKG